MRKEFKKLTVWAQAKSHYVGYDCEKNPRNRPFGRSNSFSTLVPPKPGSGIVMLYAWGANSHGQLGVGSLEDKHSPCPVGLLSEHPPSIIACGGSQSIAYYPQSGRVYVTGRSTVKDQSDHFQPLDQTLFGVTAINVGWDFYFILSSQGEVYGYGRNTPGLPGCAVKQNWPAGCLTRLPTLNLISSMAAGLRHAVIVGNGGQSISHWTHTGTTQVMLNSLEYSGSVIGCSAGAYHSAIWTNFGNVGVWGDTRFGQGGPLNRVRDKHCDKLQWIPASFFDDERIVSIKSGWSHLLALTDQGNVWSWGRSDFGQLGRDTENQHAGVSTGDKSKWQTFDPLPRKIEISTQVVSIATGSEHCLAVDIEGALWSWGWNEHGMCGVQNLRNLGAAVEPLSLSDSQWCVRKPQRIRILQYEHPCKVSCIGAGYGHSFAFLQPE